MKFFKSILAFSMLIVLTNACLNIDHFKLDNINDASWNPNLAIPLLKANVGVYNLFGATDSNAVSIDGKNVSLIYQGKTVRLKIGEVLVFDDVTIPSSPIVYTTTTVAAPPIQLDSTFNKIDEVELSAGQMTIATSGQSSSDEITFTFLDILDAQSRPLVLNVIAGNTATKELANHKITPDNGTIRFTVSATGNGNCNAAFYLTGLDFISATGDFNTGTLRLPRDSFELYVFKNIAAKGSITVSNPILSIKAKNSIGFDLKPLFDKVESTNPASGDINKLVVDPRKFGTIKSGTSTGGVVESEIRLDRDNSNIRDFIGITPKYLSHEIGLIGGSTPPNTIFKNSSCELEMNIELPLEGRVSAFEVLDTIDMQITNDLTLIKEFFIKTYTNNGFPLDTKITILLMDENRQLMRKADGTTMTLLNEVFTAAANVDGNSIVTESMIVSSEHKLLDDEVLASLPLAKYGQMRASMNTTNFGNDVVKIQSDYNLEVRVGVKITGNVNLTKKK